MAKKKPTDLDAPPPTPPGVPPDGPVTATDAGKPTPYPFGEYGTPRPADPAGELPREADPLERAAPGASVRYKVWCTNYPSARPKYFLTRPGDEAGAKALYERLVIRPDQEQAEQAGVKADDILPPVVLAKLLPD